MHCHKLLMNLASLWYSSNNSRASLIVSSSASLLRNFSQILGLVTADPPLPPKSCWLLETNEAMLLFRSVYIHAHCRLYNTYLRRLSTILDGAYAMHRASLPSFV